MSHTISFFCSWSQFMGVSSSNKFKKPFSFTCPVLPHSMHIETVSEVKKKTKKWNGMEIENCFGKIHISEKETMKEIVISTEKHQPHSYVSTNSATPTPSLPHPFTYSDMQTPVLYLSHNKVTYEGLLTAIRNPSIKSNMRIIICNFVTILLFIWCWLRLQYQICLQIISVLACYTNGSSSWMQNRRTVNGLWF